ncbi:DUF6286 domain-containing protein [Streptomyces avicenniae]|uniref:DUF6286 domain-containing protein n=1 Tax=Streptomyces avicenniae TaxID=500153 RepID=UPI00069BEE5D|nr:DUF6286 domain-containing protein [Streptomyces avicenniae]
MNVTAAERPPEPDAAPDAEEAHAHPARRFWSERRVPAVLVAAATLITGGPLLYDIVAVRADRPATQWRRNLADGLDSRAMDDAWVITGCAAAIAVGVCLVVLAVTPGLRGILPMRRRAAEQVRSGIERSAVGVVLRDRALAVSGVRAVRVTAGRHRVRVLAESHFRDLDVVRADLDAVLADGVRDLGLSRRPALTVHAHRPAKR